jgi:hypothetical protein
VPHRLVFDFGQSASVPALSEAERLREHSHEAIDAKNRRSAESHHASFKT